MRGRCRSHSWGRLAVMPRVMDQPLMPIMRTRKCPARFAPPRPGCRPGSHDERHRDRALAGLLVTGAMLAFQVAAMSRLSLG